MQFVLDLVRARESDFIRRRFEIALVLSLILHGVALWKWFPREPLMQGEKLTQADQPLSLRITPQRQQQPTVTPPAPQKEAPPPTVVQPTPRPRPVPRPAPPRPAPPPVPPVIVAPPAPTPPPVAMPPPTPPVATAPPTPSPPVTSGDLSSFIAERRRARGESGDAPTNVDSESARRDRAIAANLASMQTSTFGDVPRNGGGTFQIRSLNYDDAQFSFYGWSKEINRRTFQLIDVRKGTNENINIAIVRKIISIIRDYEPGDFQWHSLRLGRDLTLSARQADNAELERFMMEEFFSSGRVR